MRVAIYFSTDADDPLTLAAQAWIGRNAFTGDEVPVVETGHASAEAIRDWSAFPRLYGFHATIKAPFRLKEGQSFDALSDALAAFAARQAPVVIPELVLGDLEGFSALVPAEQPAALSALERSVVETFEPFRAPMPADELLGRSEGLTERQKHYLEAWGYPFVLEEFRYHMTLTRRLSGDDHAAARRILAEHFAPFLGKPLTVGSLSLFVQHDGNPFTIAKTHHFAGGNHG